MAPGWEAKFLEGPPTIIGMYNEIEAILLCANIDELKVIIPTRFTHLRSCASTVLGKVLASSLRIFYSTTLSCWGNLPSPPKQCCFLAIGRWVQNFSRI